MMRSRPPSASATAATMVQAPPNLNCVTCAAASQTPPKSTKDGYYVRPRRTVSCVAESLVVGSVLELRTDSGRRDWPQFLAGPARRRGSGGDRAAEGSVGRGLVATRPPQRRAEAVASPGVRTGSRGDGEVGDHASLGVKRDIALVDVRARCQSDSPSL